MLLSGRNKFVSSPFTSEDELKNMVIKNPNYFFGQSAFCLSKELISESGGFGEFSDGFAINISNRQWFVLCTTLPKHNVWSHIAPQVVKQLIASEQLTTKQLLIETIILQLKKNKEIIKIFSDEGYLMNDESVFTSKVRSVLVEIFEHAPLVAMPTETISKDLSDWASTLKVNVKFCIVNKYVEDGNSENIIYEIPVYSVPAECGDGYLNNTRRDTIGKDYPKSQNSVLDRLTDKIDVSEIPY